MPAPAAPSPEVPAAPEATPVSHDEWVRQCQAILPEGAEIDKNSCVYSLNGEQFAQKCKSENGAMSLDGDPMQIKPVAMPTETPAAPAVPAPPPVDAAAQAEIVALRAERDAANAARDAADAEAKATAFASSGVKPSLANTIMTTLAKSGGETWLQAVARDQVERPDAYGSVPVAAPVVEQAPAIPVNAPTVAPSVEAAASTRPPTIEAPGARASGPIQLGRNR